MMDQILVKFDRFIQLNQFYHELSGR